MQNGAKGCRDSACTQRYCCALRSFSEVGADTESTAVGESTHDGNEKPPGNGGSVCGMVKGPVRRLDGEGVLKALHALFQVLDLVLLLGQEEVFDPVQAGG
jgi:hypothetical protein